MLLHVAKKTIALFAKPLLLMTFTLAVTIGATSLVVAAPKYPEPISNVSDYAKILSPDDVAKIEALIDAVLKQTGTTFAVAIFEDLGDESVPMYAANLYEAWGIGEKGKDKGLLLLIAMAQRDMRMEVGYGLEPVITDARAGECLDKMVPFFQDGQYGPGIYAGLWHAAQYVADDAGVELVVDPGSGAYRDAVRPSAPSLPLAFAGIILSVLGLIIVIAAVRGSRCPRCKSRLAVVDKVVQNATYSTSGIAVRIYDCPKCGYHKEQPYKTAPLVKPPGSGGGFPMGPGPWIGGGTKSGSKGGGFFGPRGFGGGRSGGGGAGRKW